MSTKDNKNQRCSICNYVNFDDMEWGDTPQRSLHYHKDTDEFVCSVCENEIFDAVSEFDHESYLEWPQDEQRGVLEADLGSTALVGADHEEAAVAPPLGSGNGGSDSDGA